MTLACLCLCLWVAWLGGVGFAICVGDWEDSQGCRIEWEYEEG